MADSLNLCPCSLHLTGSLQKWSSQLSDRPDAVIPQTAARGLAACDRQAFPLIHTFLSIFLSLRVSTASAERSFSTLKRLKTWMKSLVGEERSTGLAILHVHRDIAVNVDKVIDRFAWLILFYEIKWNESVCNMFYNYECEDVLLAVVDV